MHDPSPPMKENRPILIMADVPDELLIDQVLTGQAGYRQEAFGELYQRHVIRIYRYQMARTGNEADAQDLTAQTFLAALESIHTYRKQRPFSSWLYGIASHKVVDHYRRQRNHIPLESIAEFHDGAPSLDETLIIRLDMAQVALALRKITPERAEALVWRIFAGLSAVEVGQIMGKSETAVRMLVMRGLEDLRHKLSVPAEVEK